MATIFSRSVLRNCRLVLNSCARAKSNKHHPYNLQPIHLSTFVLRLRMASSLSQVAVDPLAPGPDATESKLSDGMKQDFSDDQTLTNKQETTDDHTIKVKNESSNDQTQKVTVNDVKTTKTDTEEKVPYVRIKKKKVVLLLSYSGQGYYGMQKNPDTKTIEDELLKALLKAAYIDEEGYNRPQTIKFQRAARTDKNVSAARQIVSLLLPEHVEASQINEFLPPQIRLMGIKRVTKGFDSKGYCEGRTYMYMIPTFAFVPIDGRVTEDYRITPEALDEVRKTLNLYVGTKNFHNFTSRKKPTDPSAKRYIMAFTCSDPLIKDGMEYVILKVKGQSFMLHQIRKMIGLATAVVRGFADFSTVEKSWTIDRIDIPKAPGVGLVLDQVHYDKYDERYGKDGMHEKLTWEAENENIEKFCHEFIYPIITKCENEEKSMFNWLETLAYHSYDVISEGTPRGLAIKNAALLVAKERGVTITESSDEEDEDEDATSKSKRRKIDIFNKN